MDVSEQPLHKYVVMCLLIQECYFVIQLVGIKQIPNFLGIMIDDTLKRAGYFSRNLLSSIALREDFDHHLCFGKISWYLYWCEDFEKKAQSV